MKLLCIFLVATIACAAPQGYEYNTPSESFSGTSFSVDSCGPDQVRQVDGNCVTPRVNRRVFFYDIPASPPPVGQLPDIPEPTVETNILFIRTPEQGTGPDPIIIPPPRQEHVVYILNKQSGQGQRVIEVPGAPQSDPQVYFVNYADGENPLLPSGVDLQTALNAAGQDGNTFVSGGIIDGGLVSGGTIDGGFVNGGNIEGNFVSGGLSGNIGSNLLSGSVDFGVSGSLGAVGDFGGGNVFSIETAGISGGDGFSTNSGFVGDSLTLFNGDVRSGSTTTSGGFSTSGNFELSGGLSSSSGDRLNIISL